MSIFLPSIMLVDHLHLLTNVLFIIFTEFQCSSPQVNDLNLILSEMHHTFSISSILRNISVGAECLVFGFIVQTKVIFTDYSV